MSNYEMDLIDNDERRGWYEEDDEFRWLRIKNTNHVRNEPTVIDVEVKDLQLGESGG